MKVKELIRCLQVDESDDYEGPQPIDENMEIEILTGVGEVSYILSIYIAGGSLCIDIGDE